VESIVITNQKPLANFTIVLTNAQPTVFTPELIMGLLTTPKFHRDPITQEFLNTNRVVAIVKAITGSAAEKGALTNEFSFRYMLDVSVIPDDSLLGRDTNVTSRVLNNNLHDVRVVLRWPVFQRGDGVAVGNNRRTFRGKVSGMLVTNDLAFGSLILPTYQIKPNTYAHLLP
jgi:hypothetical protein